MKILVIGSGGREHAIAWKLLQSARVQTVYVAPGNGGTGSDNRLHNVPLTDFKDLAEFAEYYIRDVMLPADLKRSFMSALQQRQEAQAGLEKARPKPPG